MKKIVFFLLPLIASNAYSQPKKHIESVSLNYNVSLGYDSQNMNNMALYHKFGDKYIYVSFDDYYFEFGAVSLKFNFQEYPNHSFCSFELYQLQYNTISLYGSYQDYEKEKINYLEGPYADYGFWKIQSGINYNYKLLGDNKESGLFMQFSTYLCYRYLDDLGTFSFSDLYFSNIYTRFSIGPFLKLKINSNFYLETVFLCDLLDCGFKYVNYNTGFTDFGTFVDFNPSYTFQVGINYSFRLVPKPVKNESKKREDLKAKLHRFIDEVL
jgi:hypothetical protein